MVVVEVVEVVEVVVAVAAAARTGPRDERISKLGGEGRVQPDRRRLRVQRLQRQLQRARLVGVGVELGLLVAAALGRQLVAHGLGAPAFGLELDELHADAALGALGVERVGVGVGVGLGGGEERELLRVDAELLLRQLHRLLAAAAAAAVAVGAVAVAVGIAAAAVGLLALRLLLLLLLRLLLRRHQLHLGAQPAVDVGAQLALLPRDCEPRPPLCAHRRLLRAHLAEAADAAVLVHLDVLELLALRRRPAAVEELQRRRRQPVDAHL